MSTWFFDKTSSASRPSPAASVSVNTSVADSTASVMVRSASNSRTIARFAGGVVQIRRCLHRPRERASDLGYAHSPSVGDGHFRAAKPGAIGDRDLEHVRLLRPLHAVNTHTIRAGIVEVYRREVGHDIRRDVGAGIAHLVQDLLRHDLPVDEPAGIGPGGGALDELEFAGGRALPRFGQGCGAECRRCGLHRPSLNSKPSATGSSGSETPQIEPPAWYSFQPEPVM